MSHPLENKIAALRARLRRLIALYGASWTVGIGLTALVLLGLTDYLIRFEDRGLRIIASLLVLAAVGGAAYRFLYLGLSSRWRDVDIALRVQRRFPALGDELASAVEFLYQSEEDPTAGSVALRRAVISEATAVTERLDFEDSIEGRPARRAATVAGIVGATALVVVLFNPAASGIALARLLNPFGGTDWPRPQQDRVVVADPPSLESLTARLIPPPYTGWPPEQVEQGIRALVGTQVEVSGRAAKPLAAATLCLDGDRKIPAQLGEDGFGFTLAASASGFVVETTGSYWLRLEDQDGLSTETPHQEVRAIPDSPPRVAIEQPNANIFVTPRAEVPIRVTANDDLAIRQIALEFVKPEGTPKEKEAGDGWRKSPDQEKDKVQGKGEVQEKDAAAEKKATLAAGTGPQDAPGVVAIYDGPPRSRRASGPPPGPTPARVLPASTPGSSKGWASSPAPRSLSGPRPPTTGRSRARASRGGSPWSPPRRWPSGSPPDRA